MANLLDQLKLQTAEAEAVKKAEAEAKEAEAENARQNDAKKLADETRIQRVRDALHISPEKYTALAAQHKVDLQAMVAQNRELVGDAATALRNAEAAGINVSREQRIGIVKQTTVEGLRVKHDELRAAEAAGKTSEYLKANFDYLTPEEVASLENADPESLNSLKTSVSARLAEKEKLQAAEGGEGDAATLKAVEERLNATKKDVELAEQKAEAEMAQELTPENFEKRKVKIHEKIKELNDYVSSHYDTKTYWDAQKIMKIVQDIATPHQRGTKGAEEAWSKVAESLISRVDGDPKLKTDMLNLIAKSNEYQAMCDALENDVNEYDTFLRKYSLATGDSTMKAVPENLRRIQGGRSEVQTDSPFLQKETIINDWSKGNYNRRMKQDPFNIDYIPHAVRLHYNKELSAPLTESSSMEVFAREKNEITKGLDALRSRVATELQPAESALAAAENNRPKRESVIPPFRTRDYIDKLTIELNNANSEEAATIETREKKIQSDYYQNQGLEIFEDDKKDPEFMKALGEYKNVFNELAPAYQNLLKRANTYNKEMHGRVNKTGEKAPSDVWLEKTGIGLTNPWRFPGGVDEGVKNRYKMHGISDALEI